MLSLFFYSLLFFCKFLAKIRMQMSVLTCRVATVSLSDPVCVATRKMRELRVNSVIVTAGNSLHGIFT